MSAVPIHAAQKQTITQITFNALQST